MDSVDSAVEASFCIDGNAAKKASGRTISIVTEAATKVSPPVDGFDRTVRQRVKNRLKIQLCTTFCNWRLAAIA